MGKRRDQITQREMAFYKLYKAYKEDQSKWVAVWEFIGEIYIEELNKWAFMSYKTPANGLSIFFDNPDLLERRKVTGKSGARYYEYRIAPNPTAEKIRDEQLLSFYKRIKK